MLNGPDKHRMSTHSWKAVLLKITGRILYLKCEGCGLEWSMHRRLPVTACTGSKPNA